MAKTIPDKMPDVPNREVVAAPRGREVEVNLSALSFANRDVLYARADLSRVCRLDDDFAISFYQLDYQSYVDGLVAAPEGKIKLDHANAVGKILMNAKGLSTLIKDLKDIAEKSGIEWPTK